MNKKLVNHGGVIQWKYIIENSEQLLEYAKINDAQFASQFEDIIFKSQDELEEVAKKNTHHGNILAIAQSGGTSVLEATVTSAQRKIMGMLKNLQRGYTLVVNRAGGYTYWDDKEMSFVKETPENILEAQIGVDEFTPQVRIVESQVLILENQKVSDRVLNYVKNELKQSEYSIASNLRFAEGNTGRYIKEALQKGCRTIVAETTLANRDQLEELGSLFQKLPPMNFHLFVYGDLEKELTDIFGEETTKNIFASHNIKILK